MVSLLTVWMALFATDLRARAQEGPSATLAGRSWQLLKFQSSACATLQADDASTYTISFERNGSVSVRIDCNRRHGSWRSSKPGQIELGPMALTRAMCQPASLSDRLPKDWQNIRSYAIKNGHLFLTLADGAGIYEFEPVLSSQASDSASPVSSVGPVSYDCVGRGTTGSTLSATFYQTTPALILVKLGMAKLNPGFKSCPLMDQNTKEKI
jgi:para-nitrobenzyl esterase